MNAVIFILRRLGHALFVLVGLSILIFLIARIVPGDPARMSLGANAPDWVVQNLRQKMHLDKPLPVQYVLWLGGVVRGDFGESLYTKRPVLEDFADFLPATVELILFAGIIMAVGGILLGILSAKYSSSWVDALIRLVSYVGVVTPAFVFAIIFVLVFGQILQWLPVIGRLTPGMAVPPRVSGMVCLDSLLALDPRAFLDGLKHLVLPGIALALGGLSQEARITRSSMTDNMSKDYILAQRAYGTPEGRILRRYLLKPSLIPTVSVLGLDFAVLFGNAFLVEMVFNWPGLSRYGINVMLQKDLNAISAVIIVLGLIFIVVNIITDLVISFLDPRIRLGAGRV
jgi:peptide/nickel transport system permease protein